MTKKKKIIKNKTKKRGGMNWSSFKIHTSQNIYETSGAKGLYNTVSKAIPTNHIQSTINTVSKAIPTNHIQSAIKTVSESLPTTRNIPSPYTFNPFSSESQPKSGIESKINDTTKKSVNPIVQVQSVPIVESNTKDPVNEVGRTNEVTNTPANESLAQSLRRIAQEVKAPVLEDQHVNKQVVEPKESLVNSLTGVTSSIKAPVEVASLTQPVTEVQTVNNPVVPSESLAKSLTGVASSIKPPVVEPSLTQPIAEDQHVNIPVVEPTESLVNSLTGVASSVKAPVVPKESLVKSLTGITSSIKPPVVEPDVPSHAVPVVHDAITAPIVPNESLVHSLTQVASATPIPVVEPNALDSETLSPSKANTGIQSSHNEEHGLTNRSEGTPQNNQSHEILKKILNDLSNLNDATIYILIILKYIVENNNINDDEYENILIVLSKLLILTSDFSDVKNPSPTYLYYNVILIADVLKKLNIKRKDQGDNINKFASIASTYRRFMELNEFNIDQLLQLAHKYDINTSLNKYISYLFSRDNNEFSDYLYNNIFTIKYKDKEIKASLTCKTVKMKNYPMKNYIYIRISNGERGYRSFEIKIDDTLMDELNNYFTKKYENVTIEDRDATYRVDEKKTEKIIKIYTTYSDFMDKMKN